MPSSTDKTSHRKLARRVALLSRSRKKQQTRFLPFAIVCPKSWGKQNRGLEGLTSATLVQTLGIFRHQPEVGLSTVR